MTIVCFFFYFVGVWIFRRSSCWDPFAFALCLAKMPMKPCVWADGTMVHAMEKISFFFDFVGDWKIGNRSDSSSSFLFSFSPERRRFCLFWKKKNNLRFSFITSSILLPLKVTFFKTSFHFCHTEFFKKGRGK